LLISKNGRYNSYSHFVYVAFVSIMVFQAFVLTIFGRLGFPRTR